MRILTVDEKPLHEWWYLNAAPRGGTRAERLPLLCGWVDSLPPDVDAVIALSDLQGMAPHALRDGAAALLGEVLADELAMMGEAGDIPLASRTGILLAGDLFSSPGAEVRGASGDVRSVWSAFSASFRWVVGVAGNHDTFGRGQEQARFFHQPGRTLLDGEVVAPDGLSLGGVSYIIGRPDKLNRREQSAQLERIESVLLQEPEVLLLHEGPDVPGTNLRGNAVIREAVEPWSRLLVICGHCHWDVPLATLAGGTQVLNVDARAVLLRRAGT
ncbi:metallophosphoesterase [Corallococcus sp. Z5C101001]|uniref:metallophosphoesterase family protein n=1 Tax=Corallococcus sp. Z5C101001 TaxID=2596829 RepID=UPI0021029405|nr:metallophosphoesterase [Corallococcus sp. Z5C101001]